MKLLKFRNLALLVLCLFQACGGNASPGSPDLAVEDPWVRASLRYSDQGEGAANSAGYMVLRNRGGVPDTLVGGTTPVAGAVAVHESRMEGEIMRMLPVAGLEVPAGGEAVLAPGGYHIMLEGLLGSLTEGDTVRLLLEFRRSGRLEVLAPVRGPAVP